MANPDRPFGLRPVRYRSGAPYNGAANPYYIGTGDGTALFLGDPVAFAGNSNSASVGDGRHAAGTLPAITKATAAGANLILGVVVGVEWIQRDSLVYREASTERVILVADDPDLIFHIQDDASGTPSADNVSLNASLVFTHTGSTTTGLSGAELNGSTFATTRTLQLHVERAAHLPNNSVAQDFCIWEVMINQHQLREFGGLGAVLGI